MTSTNDTRDPDDPNRTDDRTGLLLTADGVVIYDVENPSGWIQSDESVALVDRQ